MIAIVNNFRRLFSDQGHDRDFSGQEQRLQQARAALIAEADGLKRAAEALADMIRLRS